MVKLDEIADDDGGPSPPLPRRFTTHLTKTVPLASPSFPAAFRAGADRRGFLSRPNHAAQTATRAIRQLRPRIMGWASTRKASPRG